MQEIQIIDYKGLPVRVAYIDNNRWWSFCDICKKVLDYTQFEHIKKKLKSDEHKVVSIKNKNSVGGRRMTFVNEVGLQKILNFSCKPKAEIFKKWLESKFELPNWNDELKPPLQIKPSAEAGIQKAQMLIRIAEHKAIPKSEQLRLLSMAVKELTGSELNFESTEQLADDSDIMKLPEVVGFIKQKESKKFGSCQLEFYPAEHIANRIGITAQKFDKLANEHNFKNSHTGVWEEVTTPQGKAREFMYLHGAPYFYRGNGEFTYI